MGFFASKDTAKAALQVEANLAARKQLANIMEVPTPGSATTYIAPDMLGAYRKAMGNGIGGVCSPAQIAPRAYSTTRHLSSGSIMHIQVTPMENGYVVAIACHEGEVPRLFYAADLAGVGQQVTAFGVTQELEGKGANT